MAKKKAVGLEMSARYLRGVEIEGIGSKTPTVKKIHEIAIEPGAVKDGEVIDVDFMANALERLWSEAKFTTREVVIGLGNERVLVRSKTIAAVALPNARQALPFLSNGELPVDPDDAVLDYYPIRHDEQLGQIEGLMIAGVKTIIDSNTRALEKAKLIPLKIDLLPFALVRSLMSTKQPPEGVSVVLSISGRSTSITVVEGLVPTFVRFIPAGSDNVVDGIVKLTKLDYEKSLQLQNKLGVGATPTDPSSQKVAQTINEEVNAIYRSIRNTLKYYQDNNPQSKYNTILLVGSGSRIPGLSDSLSKAFGVPVQFGDPFTNVVLDKTLTNNQDKISLELSAPVGLALGA